MVGRDVPAAPTASSPDWVIIVVASIGCVVPWTPLDVLAAPHSSSTASSPVWVILVVASLGCVGGMLMAGASQRYGPAVPQVET